MGARRDPMTSKRGNKDFYKGKKARYSKLVRQLSISTLNPFNGDKSMFKCREISRSRLWWLPCACLDCILPGIELPLGLDFFLRFSQFQTHI